MGSACCVPARKQGSGGGRETAADPAARWRRSGNEELSPTWDGKSFFPEPVGNGNLYRCSFSSSSRGSRRGSSRFSGHQRSFQGPIFSPDPSPSSSFRSSHINPLSSSQVCPLAVDLAPLPLESSLSPCTTITSKESASNTPESLPSFTSNTKDSPIQPPIRPIIGSSSSSNSSSFVSKLSKTLREKPQRRGLTNTNTPTDDSFTTTRFDAVDLETPTSSDWSMVAFSELVASSRRDRLRWMSDGNGDDLAELAELELSALDRIRAAGYMPASFESFICGLCSRWLSQSSPLTAHKMVAGNFDPPSVGVLACGHVFHSDCLEQATSETERQDPSCPQCCSWPDGGDRHHRGLFKTRSLHGSTTPASAAKSKQLAGDEPEVCSSSSSSFRGLRIFSSASQELVKREKLAAVPDRSIKSCSRKFSFRRGSSRQSSGAANPSSSSSGFASGSKARVMSSASPEGSPSSSSRRRRSDLKKW